MSKSRICIDCGREFDCPNKAVTRCGDCQAAHKAAAFRHAIGILDKAWKRQNARSTK